MLYRGGVLFTIRKNSAPFHHRYEGRMPLSSCVDFRGRETLASRVCGIEIISSF